MVSIEEIEFLKARAFEFLKNARELAKKKVYDLAAFNAEQFCQLLLKYFLFLKLGDYPKTHSLKKLLAEIEKVYPRIKKLKEKHIETISNLENAYIAARYFPFELTSIEMERMLKFCELLRKFFKL